eukprot:1418058-Heterocapsa_arctica.AAC.1
MYTRDLISLAVARFRAIELANGTGVINDADDVEQWMGVDEIHPEESRKLPVLWTNDGYVITLLSDPDGFASYGRVHLHGTAGVVANSISRHDAARIPDYSSENFHNIGFNPELAI